LLNDIIQPGWNQDTWPPAHIRHGRRWSAMHDLYLRHSNLPDGQHYCNTAREHCNMMATLIEREGLRR
jgi:hypothetical protein